MPRTNETPRTLPRTLPDEKQRPLPNEKPHALPNEKPRALPNEKPRTLTLLDEKPRSLAEFEQQYAQRSGCTVEDLHRYGSRGVVCK